MKKYIYALFLCLFANGMNAAIYVSGTMNSWAVANATYQLLDNGNGVFYISLDLPAGTHHFKLTDGTWGNSVASDRIITLAAPAIVNIYAKTSKSFVCDTQDAFYITGSATGTYAWGGANMLPMTIVGQQAVVTTTITTGQQGNIYRDLTPNYQEPIYRPSNFSFPADLTIDGKTKVITFDFATYTLSFQDPTPLITSSVSSLTGLSYFTGSGPSAEQSFTLGGAYLTSDITVTPPADFEISTTTGTGFQSTPITLTQASGSVSSTTIYVRLKAGLSIASYSNENIVCTSTNAIVKNIACSGAVNPKIYVTGTFNSWTNPDTNYLLVDNGNGVFYIAINLPAGTHHFKLTDGTWGNSVANDRIVTLAAPATIKIYAKTSKGFVCDTQDAFYITGSATGTYVWGGANMLPMTIVGQKAVVTTKITTGQQGNMYRDLTPNYQEPIYRPSNFSFPTDVTMDGKTKVITFDFATFSFSLQYPVATAVPTTTKDNFTYSVNNKQIHVNVDNSIIEIYTVSGQKLFSKVVSGSVEYRVENSGIYLLRSKGTIYKVIIP